MKAKKKVTGKKVVNKTPEPKSVPAMGQVVKINGAPVVAKSAQVESAPLTRSQQFIKDHAGVADALAVVNKKPKAEVKVELPRDPDIHEQWQRVEVAEKETYDLYYADAIDHHQADGQGFVIFAGKQVDVRTGKREPNPENAGRWMYTIKDVPIKKRTVDLIVYD